MLDQCFIPLTNYRSSHVVHTSFRHSHRLNYIVDFHIGLTVSQIRFLLQYSPGLYGWMDGLYGRTDGSLMDGPRRRTMILTKVTDGGRRRTGWPSPSVEALFSQYSIDNIHKTIPFDFASCFSSSRILISFSSDFVL